MTVELFTTKDYNAGLRPQQTRDGKKITAFTYFAGADFCFVGVDSAGVTHMWRATGRKNGVVNNMGTDLVKLVADPNAEIFYLARTVSGNFYAGNEIGKLRDAIKLAPEFDLYQFEINFKKSEVTEWRFIERVKVPKK
jgi:hypothetical protein